MTRLPWGTGPAEFERLAAIESDACTEWPYGRDGDDYGSLRVGQVTKKVHREATILHHGPPPFAGAMARHSCNNPPCMNPRHLSWATQSVNELDKVAAGTHHRGDRHHAVKLTEDDACTVKTLYAQGGVTQKSLAEDLGVSREAIARILQGRNWAWVP